MGLRFGRHRRRRACILKVTRITAWQVDLPLAEGSFHWSGGTLDAFDSTVVRVDTDEGISGWGEVSPLGPAYLPSYAEGARTGIRHLAPYLIGEVATDLTPLNLKMDSVLRGHPYAKSPIDMACWDILGKAAGLPLSTLMGGTSGDSIRLYRAISQDTADVMAEKVREYQAQGYQRFQLKLGGDPEVDLERVGAIASVLRKGDTLIADANRGWLMHEAARIVAALRDLDVYIEQPCSTYEECLSIRRRTALPFILDESMDSLGVLIRGYSDSAMDMINIKISKFGGLTRAMHIRDVCAELGIGMIIEDSCGGDLATAAVTHLAQSTPEELRFSSTDLNGYVTRSYDDDAPTRQGGQISAPLRPGLGVEPNAEQFGPPVIEVGEA